MDYRFIPPPASFESFDFASARDRLIRLGATQFQGYDFDDMLELLVMLLEGESWVLDVLGYYVRNLGRESRVATARQRRNMVGLLKLISYRPRGAVAAQWTQTFTLRVPAPAAILIPEGAVVKTGDVSTPVRFQLLGSVAIAQGATSGSGTVEHSTAQTDVFTSTVQPFQSFRLSRTPYLDGSAIIGAGNGDFLEVTNFYKSLPTDRHFTSEPDEFDRVTVTFGNGISGMIPTGTITVAYKTGGGVDGNVAIGAAAQVEGTIVDSVGGQVRLVTSNVAVVLKGQARETIEQMRVNGPASVTTGGDRTVTDTDFEVNTVRGVGGIARALCLMNDRDPGVEENTANVYVLTEDGGAPPDGMLDSVVQLFKLVPGATRPLFPCLNTLRVHAFGALRKVVDVSVVVFRRAGYLPAVVKANVLAALGAFFEVRISSGKLKGVLNPLVNFGFYIQDKDGNPTNLLAWSDLESAVLGAAGVLRMPPNGLVLNGEVDDVTIAKNEFPKAGTFTVLDGATGLPL